MKYILQGALPNAFICITACDSQFLKGDNVVVPFYRWENKRSQRLNASHRGGRVKNLGTQTSGSHMHPRFSHLNQGRAIRVKKLKASFPLCSLFVPFQESSVVFIWLWVWDSVTDWSSPAAEGMEAVCVSEHTVLGTGGSQLVQPGSF